MASKGRSRLKDRSLEQCQASSTLEQLFQMKLKSGGSLKDCTSHCSSDKAEVHMEMTTYLSKVKLMRSLVISIFLYACEWTLTTELEKRMQAFEMRCYRKLLNISYKDHVTYEEVLHLHHLHLPIMCWAPLKQTRTVATISG